MGAYKLAYTYHFQGWAPRFLHGWMKKISSPRHPTMIGWTTHSSRVVWNEVRSSIIPALCDLTLEFPIDMG